MARFRSTGKGERAGSVKVAGTSKAAKAPKAPKAPKDKAAAKAARLARRTARKEKFGQVRQAFTMTRKADKRLVPLLLAALLGPFLLMLAIGLLVGFPVVFGFLGLLIGLVLATAVFGRRVQAQAMTQVEGQVGAAAAVLTNMRGDWRVTPVVGFNREQDMVHRVVGRPGVILVGEGAVSRTRGLVVTEKKRLSRFVGETPVYDVLVGEGEGQVALRSLEKHFAKLPRNVKPKDVNVLDRRLKAMAPASPLPKGPLPKGGRMPRGKVR